MKQIRRRDVMVRIAGVFVELDMPDPRTHWAEMAGCIGLVLLISVALLALLVLLP